MPARRRARSRAACAAPFRGSSRRRVRPRRSATRAPPSNSTSAEAFDRLPSLSFRRLIRIGVARAVRQRRAAAGSTTSPASSCASTRCASHCGAEKNHLWPVSRTRRRRRRARRACDCCGRRSRPAARSCPCRSARHAWRRRARRAGRSRAPGSSAANRARAAAASRAARRSTGTLAYVIVSGHCVPFSTCACRCTIAARATCAPGRGIGPRRAMDARGGGEAHQLVPCRMERDVVDALAARVVRRELGRMPIRGVAERERRRASKRRAPVAQPRRPPTRRLRARAPPATRGRPRTDCGPRTAAAGSEMGCSRWRPCGRCYAVRGARKQHDGGEDQRAARHLHRRDALAQHERRERHGDERLERGERRGARRADALRGRRNRA